MMDNARKPIFQISPSSWIGSGATGWRRSWPSCIRETRFTYHQFRIKKVTLYQARNSGPNIDQVMTLSKCKSRGQRHTDQHVQRCVKSARRADDHLALPRRTRDVIETFVPLAEGAILEPAKALPAPASEAPIHPAPLLTTMSWPAAFELMVFLVIQYVKNKRT